MLGSQFVSSSRSDVEASPDDQRRNARLEKSRGGTDMTPMVDVTFLLLIFFMVTASFQLQKSIAMPPQRSELPSPTAVPDDSDPQIEVQIDPFGSFLVLAPAWELETPGKQRLVSALRDAADQSDGKTRLAVQVHEMAKLRWLVDALDAATIAGYSEISVTQVESF